MKKFSLSAIPALLAVAALVSGCGSSGYGGSSGGRSVSKPSVANGEQGVTVKTASIPSAGGTVLVDGEGMTLYSLSAERNGKFICTNSSCTAVWHPLVATGTTPTGVESLGTIKRPDGSGQVTYKGMPLYTFAQDAKPGDDKGQGFKDVGTWSAVVASGSSGGAPAVSTSTEPSYGGRY